MDHGNGSKTYVSDGTTQPLPKPQRLIGSPADLMEPDRYEFYTFDETGDLVKRLMTLEEIQSLIAAGGDSEGIVGGPSLPPYYDQNLKTNAEQEQTLQTMDTEQNSDMPGVYKVVQNVQNVLKGELAASQAKPLNQIPDLSMPDASSSWSILFPNVLDDSLTSDINHLSEVLPEAEPSLKIPPSVQITTSSNIPQRRPVTSTESLKFVNRQPTTSESSLVIHYLPINAVPSKTHNKKPNKPVGGSYDKYKPPKETTTHKTTYQEATSTKPSMHVSTWSTLVSEPSSTTKQNMEAIKLNPQLSDSFSNMLNQVTENPHTVIDDKYTKPSSAIPNSSTMKVKYTSIPLTTTMKVPNPVSTTVSSDSKYKNTTKTQVKYKKPTESVKLNVTRPVSTFGTTQYNRIPTATSKPFNGNNIQTAETKRPSVQSVTKQNEHISELKNNGLQIQNLQNVQQSSSQKHSTPVRTTPYNSNNVHIQASSQRPTVNNELRENTKNSAGSTKQDTSTKTYNPTQYVNNQPLMSSQPSTSNTIQPYTTVKPFTFFTTPDDSIFSEPYISNASTQIYNPTLYINNQPVLSTKPIQLVSPLRQSTTPLYYSKTDTPQILSSQSYVSKPNPFLQNKSSTTPRTTQFSTNRTPSYTPQNTTSSSPSKPEQLKTKLSNNSNDKNTQTNKRNVTTTSNELRNNIKPVKLTSEPPQKLDQIKSNNTSLPSKISSPNNKNKVTNTTTIQNKTKLPPSNQNKPTTKENLVSQTLIAESKTNTPLPPKSNINRPNGNFSTPTKQSNNVKGALKTNSTSSTKTSQVSQALTESALNKIGTTERNKEYATTIAQQSNLTKTNIIDDKKPSETGTKKPLLQNINKNVTIAQKNNITNIKKQNSTKTNLTNATRAPDNVNRKTANKPTESYKNGTKVSSNTQIKVPIKYSQSTSPKPFSSTQQNTLSIERNTERINVEQINNITDRPYWSTMSDQYDKVTTPSESTIYIRVNTTNPPQAPSTEKSQSKITFTRYPESSNIKYQSSLPNYSQRYPESTSVKQQASNSPSSSQRYPESTSVKQQSYSSPNYNQRHPESTSVKQQLSSSPNYGQRYPESTSVKQQSNSSPNYSQRHPESTSVKQQTSTVPSYSQKYPDSTSTKQQSITTSDYSNYNQIYPESTSAKQQDYTQRNPESQSDKLTSSYTPEYPHHLEHIVHDGISAVTNMLQYNTPPVTPILDKIPSENLSQKKDSVVSDSFSNLTTETISSTDDVVTETAEQTTPETNYMEIQQNFVSGVNSKSTTASQVSSSSVATVPVMGETKHASTEAMQQLLDELIAVTSDSISPIAIESAALIKGDLEEATSTVTSSTQDAASTSSSPSSVAAANEISSVFTDATKSTTAIDEEQNRQELTTISADENLSLTTEVEITTQSVTEQDVELYQQLENNKTFEKIESTLEPITSNTETYTDTTTDKYSEAKQSDEFETSTYDSPITTDSPSASEQTTEFDAITTGIPTTLGMLSELRTEAMDLAMETTPMISSTTETLVTPDKHLNSTLVMSTSTVQTTATPLDEQTSNKPTKTDHQELKTAQEPKEPIEQLKASGGVAVKPPNQKPSVELHPPPHEHMGLEASIAYLGDDIKRFADLCNELAFKMWTSLTGKGMVSSRSLVLSPFAATSTLAMVFLGARGPTSGQMNDLLRLDDMVSFNPHQVLQNVTDSVVHAKRNGIDTAAFVRELYSDKVSTKI